MKKVKITGLFLLLLLSVFSCEKVKDPAGARSVANVPLISDINPGIFDSKDLADSYVEFMVSLEPGSSADKAVVVASYNGNAQRVDVAEATSFPATIRIVSGDVIQALGLTQAEVANGDLFTLEVLLTSKGMTTRSNAVLNVAVACAFDEALTAGSYHSVSADWATDGNITLEADPADPYKIYVTGLETIDGNVEDLGPLVMHIDPATFAVTADKTVLVSAVSWGPYHNLAYAGSGVYSSCDGSYQMAFDITVDEGSFGRFAFTFTRNP